MAPAVSPKPGSASIEPSRSLCDATDTGRDENFIEKRRLARYKTVSGCMLMIPSHHVLTPVVDINEQGLSFCYPQSLNCGLSSLLDLLYCDNGFIVEGIPFSIVSVCRQESLRSYDLCQSMRFAVRFEETNPVQQSRLQYFIENYCDSF